jgi:hypothetical protein
MQRRTLATTLATAIAIIFAGTARGAAPASNVVITDTTVDEWTYTAENLHFPSISCNEELPGPYTYSATGRSVVHTTVRGIEVDGDPIALHRGDHGVSTSTLIPNDPALPTYTGRLVGSGVTFSPAEGGGDSDHHGAVNVGTTNIRETFHGSDGSSFTGVLRSHTTVTPDGETVVSHHLVECS